MIEIRVVICLGDDLTPGIILEDLLDYLGVSRQLHDDCLPLKKLELCLRAWLGCFVHVFGIRRLSSPLDFLETDLDKLQTYRLRVGLLRLDDILNPDETAVHVFLIETFESHFPAELAPGLNKVLPK